MLMKAKQSPSTFPAKARRYLLFGLPFGLTPWPPSAGIFRVPPYFDSVPWLDSY
ncbi:hypothetical protein BDV35DRAFT_353743 [Aspergillus flavus]|uniref:Uncharacterized protein n=1 Tax=Aspergillus flavus TaxID=5059 RepID=A0A5N6GYZ7_ASPFL|nr:hypothetical protein BDV35DRAFT_353743 [Aspergillus flavus]